MCIKEEIAKCHSIIRTMNDKLKSLENKCMVKSTYKEIIIKKGLESLIMKWVTHLNLWTKTNQLCTLRYAGFKWNRNGVIAKHLKTKYKNCPKCTFKTSTAKMLTLKTLKTLIMKRYTLNYMRDCATTIEPAVSTKFHQDPATSLELGGFL